MKEGEKLMVVDEGLDRLTNGKAEVLSPRCIAFAYVHLQIDQERQLLPTGPHRL